MVVLDYTTTTAEMRARPWTEWVRTYRGHERGGYPLAEPGLQDITCEVAIDQLAATRPPDLVSLQREFLRENGLDLLVEEGRRVWHERAGAPDLAALAMRSRIAESAALVDPQGLGAFTVLQWLVGGAPPLPVR